MSKMHSTSSNTPPKQTTSLTAPVDDTKLHIHSAPNGAPNRQLHGNKSRLRKHSPASSSNIFILHTHSRPYNDSRTEHNFISTIEKNPGNSEKLVQLLDYAATHPEAITRYHPSVMTLHMHSKASFLSSPGSKSRAGGYYYLSEP